MVLARNSGSAFTTLRLSLGVQYLSSYQAYGFKFKPKIVSKISLFDKLNTFSLLAYVRHKWPRRLDISNKKTNIPDISHWHKNSFSTLLLLSAAFRLDEYSCVQTCLGKVLLLFSTLFLDSCLLCCQIKAHLHHSSHFRVA